MLRICHNFMLIIMLSRKDTDYFLSADVRAHKFSIALVTRSLSRSRSPDAASTRSASGISALSMDESMDAITTKRNPPSCRRHTACPTVEASLPPIRIVPPGTSRHDRDKELPADQEIAKLLQGSCRLPTASRPVQSRIRKRQVSTHGERLSHSCSEISLNFKSSPLPLTIQFNEIISDLSDKKQTRHIHRAVCQYHDSHDSRVR